MPEAVQTFADTQDVQAVRTVQQNLLLAYEYDFSKHIDDPRLVMRVRALWNALPQQLSKEKNSCWRIYKKARASKITNSPYNGSKTAGWFTPCTASKNRICRCRAIRKTSSNYTAWTWVCSAQKASPPRPPCLNRPASFPNSKAHSPNNMCYNNCKPVSPPQFFTGQRKKARREWISYYNAGRTSS